jgi:hypothetical protein
MCSEEQSKLNVGDIIKYSEDVQYEILGFADSNETAVRILYPSTVDEQIAVANYIHELATKIYSTDTGSNRW